MKKLYSFSFTGYYPVGAVGIVCAENSNDGAKLAMEELEKKNLKQEIKPEDLSEFKLTVGNVEILLDGDY